MSSRGPGHRASSAPAGRTSRSSSRLQRQNSAPGTSRAAASRVRARLEVQADALHTAASHPQHVRAATTAEVDVRRRLRLTVRSPGDERRRLARERLLGARVDPVPLGPADAQAAEPAVEPAHRRGRWVEVEGRVGHPPRGPVGGGEQPVRVGGCREGPPLQGGGAEREDPRLLELLPDLPQQVQVAVHQEAAEHVQAADRAVGLLDVHLEGERGVAGDPVAVGHQRPLDPERLADHVDRVGVVADVGEVGVAVVADHRTVTVGTQQGAVGEEGLDADVTQRGDHLGRGVQQRLQLLAAAGVEGDDPAQVLVEADRLAVPVDDLDPALAAAQGHLPVEDLLTGPGHHHLDVRGAVEELAQRLGPGEEPPLGRRERRPGAARTTGSAGRRRRRRGRPPAGSGRGPRRRRPSLRPHGPGNPRAAM